MTILRLDMSQGGWKAVPTNIFEDKRLSLDTRGAAGFILTRTDNFDLFVSGLCTLLGIGQERWKRMNKEFTSAGYLKRIEGKDERGRFRHELVFSPVPEGGFPEKFPRKAAILNPKKPSQPDAAEPDPVPPSTTTYTNTDISNNHHQKIDGGNSEIKSNPPESWIEAANFEIEIAQKTRPVDNRDGLFIVIMKRYRASGGPSASVLASIEKMKSVKKMKEAQAASAKVKVDAASERTATALKIRAIAESKAAAMSYEGRRKLLEFVESMTNKNIIKLKIYCEAYEVFLQNGSIVPGPISNLLVQLLAEQ